MVIDLKTLYGAEATEQQKRYEELSAYFAEEFGDANALSYFSAPGRTDRHGVYLRSRCGDGPPRTIRCTW